LFRLFASAAVAGGIITARCQARKPLDSATFTFARAVTYEIMDFYTIGIHDLDVQAHNPHVHNLLRPPI
jgi:hypothetical protein